MCLAFFHRVRDLLLCAPVNSCRYFYSMYFEDSLLLGPYFIYFHVLSINANTYKIVEISKINIYLMNKWMNESVGVKVRQLNYQKIEIKRIEKYTRHMQLIKYFLKISWAKDIVLDGAKFLFCFCSVMEKPKMNVSANPIFAKGNKIQHFRLKAINLAPPQSIFSP